MADIANTGTLGIAGIDSFDPTIAGTAGGAGANASALTSANMKIELQGTVRWRTTTSSISDGRRAPVPFAEPACRCIESFEARPDRARR